MNVFSFGNTTQGLPILAYHFQNTGPKVLILGGVHGNEHEGVVCSYGLIEAFTKDFSLGLDLTIVPAFNLDGVMRHERTNARGVDLNRNLPTTDWSKEWKEAKYHPGLSANSEPENKALVAWLEKNKPDYIISLHSWKPCLNVNGDAKPEAEVIARFTGYEINDYIGYPTPGALGTYAGRERSIPTLTYEIERGLDDKRVLGEHIPPIIEALKLITKRFLK